MAAVNVFGLRAAWLVRSSYCRLSATRQCLAQTIDRLDGLVPAKNVFVITNTEQRAAVLEVCPELDPAKVIGEPVGRDTAAAVGLATILVNA